VAVKGQLEINGTEIEPIDEAQVAERVLNMVREENIRAFAVSGYAGAINPEHELAVKRVITQETGLAVTCGHELSRILNFKTRAYTAMLNARIIPKLSALISDLNQVIENQGIAAPVMVVKGDGTLMSAHMAMDRPVETILSGPAASVAGARYLTGLENAIVVDMGGTTTDTAALVDGSVSVSESGSNVGGHKTHVKALDIRTSGLGGDSLIACEEGRFVIGPKRVAPIAWLGAMYPGAQRAMEVVDSHLSRYAVSSRDLQILALTGRTDNMAFTPLEEKIVELLRIRPHSIEELVDKTDVLFASALRLQHLEENYIIQRCGLTLTDLLHVTGKFTRWNVDAAHFFCGLFSRLAHMEISDMAEHLLDMGVERLTLEILKKQLDDETDPDNLESCSVCQTLVNNLLSKTNGRYSVAITLKQPVVGIGAPIHFFLPRISENLVAETLLPENADVANAIGAITSNVLIKQHLRIIPNTDGGGFLIDGLAGAHHFEKFKEADEFARQELVDLVREQARVAGTSATAVEIEIQDNITAAADGKKVFLNRSINAKLIGKPDSALLVAN
jgi:N-methylhydantoinase A/oxoprolinase/acetone carboxylase beta subunit